MEQQQSSPALPADRAFVVQFSPGEEIAGRVEHVNSGGVKRFASWRELRAWIEQMLARAEAPHA